MTFRKSARLLPLLLTLAGWLCGATGSLCAGDVKFPADGSGVTFSVPAGWTVKADADADLTITSADGKFNFQVLSGTPLKDPAAELKAMATSIAEKAGLKDGKAETSKEITKPSGLKLLTTGFQGKKGDTELTGLLALFTTAGGTQCLFMFLDSTEAINGRDSDLGDIINSVKPAK